MVMMRLSRSIVTEDKDPTRGAVNGDAGEWIAMNKEGY